MEGTGIMSNQEKRREAAEKIAYEYLGFTIEMSHEKRGSKERILRDLNRTLAEFFPDEPAMRPFRGQESMNRPDLLIADEPASEREGAALTELLRLYDWRFELAKEEKYLSETPLVEIGFEEYERQNKELRANLRKYGREKRAAWERAREYLVEQSS